jgi:hypothetical protein
MASFSRSPQQTWTSPTPAPSTSRDPSTHRASGQTTVGILTKLDAGTHALDVLAGRVYPLKLGFIGVENRSQRDIDADKSMFDALKSEGASAVSGHHAQELHETPHQDVQPGSFSSFCMGFLLASCAGYECRFFRRL